MRRMKRRGTSWVLRVGLGLVYFCCLGVTPVLAFPKDSQMVCPREIQDLMVGMLRDLPGYVDRLRSRSRSLDEGDVYRTLILAGGAEFQPLSLAPGQAPPLLDADPQQVFFTTLEREFRGNRVSDRQDYHWLFLTDTVSGWRLVTIYTRFGAQTQGREPTPPRESSQGLVGRAIEIWLRDCRAGAIP